jgi:hypothetical protein
MARLSRPVHLYIKTHRKTGLKYFGRTVEDPYLYQGSGAYWTRHLAKYGDDVSTVIVGTYYDDVELRTAAQNFSSTNRVAESTEWANLLPENGDEAGEGWNPTQNYASRIAALDASLDRQFHSGYRVGERTSNSHASRPGNSYVSAGKEDPVRVINWHRWVLGVVAVFLAIWVFTLNSQNQERKERAEAYKQSQALGSVTCREQSRDCWSDAVPSVIEDMRQTDPVLWRACNSAAWDAFYDSWADGAAGTPPNARGSAKETIGRCQVEVTLESGRVRGVFTRLAE